MSGAAPPAPERWRTWLVGARRGARALRGARRRIGAPRIRRLILMLQNACALRCRMCDLWLERPERLPPGAAEALLASPALHPRASVHFTGGEALLYPGFAALYARARASRPGTLMSISSSGEPPEAAREFLAGGPDLKDTLLVFSYDGVGTHDRQRGVPGAEARLLSLVAEAARAFPGRVSLRMTVTPLNARAVRETFRLSRELGVGLQLLPAGHFPEHTNGLRPPDALTSPLPAPEREALAAELAAVFNALSPLRESQEMAHVLAFIERLEGRAGPRRGPCRVPSDSAFVRYDGALLTCRGAAPVGDALAGGLEAAWDSGAACRLRAEGCGGCEPRYSE